MPYATLVGVAKRYAFRGELYLNGVPKLVDAETAALLRDMKIADKRGDLRPCFRLAGTGKAAAGAETRRAPQAPRRRARARAKPSGAEDAGGFSETA